VIDTDDGALDVIEVEASDDAKAEATADELVPLVVEAGYMTTKQLRAAMKKLGVGIELQSETMKLLENEDPARLIVGWEVVDSGQGRQRAKVWRPAASRGFRTALPIQTRSNASPSSPVRPSKATTSPRRRTTREPPLGPREGGLVVRRRRRRPEGARRPRGPADL